MELQIDEYIPTPAEQRERHIQRQKRLQGAVAKLVEKRTAKLVDKKSDDPVRRESTLLPVIGALNTQATYDRKQWSKIVGIPESSLKKYGFNDDTDFYEKTQVKIDSEEGKLILKELDMLGMMHKEGPAVYLRTLQPNTYPKDRGHIIHHARFFL